MTNTNRLKAAMVANGYTQERLSKVLAMSPATFNYKLNGKREFLASEISKLVYVLNLDEEETRTIFFNPDVEFNSTKGAEND